MKTELLIQAIKNNHPEVEATIQEKPDWNFAARQMDIFFGHMANPADSLWSGPFITELRNTYYQARDEDKDCANITVRTVKAMPAAKANDTKKVFLQIANICRLFHASHKVNFEAEEVPAGFDEVVLGASKKKGIYTYASPMPALYPKTSLTFDYWVPKMLDWAEEIRSKGGKEWRNNAAAQYESCTDFMRIALAFLSNTAQLPIAKQDLRVILLENVFGEKFNWVKKAAKREDIAANNALLQKHLDKIAAQTGIAINNEAWNRIFEIKGIKEVLK